MELTRMRCALIMLAFCFILFACGEIYAYVYDVEPNLAHTVTEYIDETGSQENPPSYDEWSADREQKVEAALDWFGDECDAALNPWYSSEGD